MNHQRFNPEFLLADSAYSITNGFEKVFGKKYKRIICWAHVERAMKRNLKNIKILNKKS